MKTRKMISLLCAIAMALILSVPVFAMAVEDSSGITGNQENTFVVPRAEPHCQVGNKVGVIVTSTTKKQIGYENGPCKSGVIGGTDIRYQYQDFTSYSCTLCPYRASVGGTSYWGSWSCK